MKVLVTGMGTVSAIGRGVEATLSALKRGESGIAPVHWLPTALTHLPVGEVKESNEEMVARLGVEFPVSRLRTVLLGITAAKEAVAAAGLTDADIRDAAFINGTTVGGMDLTESFFREIYETDGESPVGEYMKYNDCGMASDLIASAIGGFGLVTTSSTACSSGANAILFAAELIKSGAFDIVVAGGAESLSRFHINGFNTLMILDPDRCRPFDRDRKGINLGEGAAYIVLESERSAKRRGVKPLAVLSGYGNACDAFHQTATSPEAEGAFLAMGKALDMAGLAPADVSYVNAHGTGTPNNDQCELTAMKRIWGDSLPRFSSTKALTGHTTSASGAIEAVISILAIRNGFIPANIGFENPIADGAAPVAETVTDADVRPVVDNSFGFGGNDSSLIFSRYEGQ